MIKLEKANIEDAKTLLAIQKEAFAKYAKIYGEFDSNPYNMDLHRMEFNIKYRYGKYVKRMNDDEIIGGIFAFITDDPGTIKLAQFYLKEAYQHHGIGKEVLQEYMDNFENAKLWYADTIMEEEHNVHFYKNLGFEVFDIEEEHEGLNFVTFVKRNGAKN